MRLAVVESAVPKAGVLRVEPEALQEGLVARVEAVVMMEFGATAVVSLAVVAMAVPVVMGELTAGEVAMEEEEMARGLR